MYKLLVIFIINYIVFLYGARKFEHVPSQGHTEILPREGKIRYNGKLGGTPYVH